MQLSKCDWIGSHDKSVTDCFLPIAAGLAHRDNAARMSA